MNTDMLRNEISTHMNTFMSQNLSFQTLGTSDGLKLVIPLRPRISLSIR